MSDFYEDFLDGRRDFNPPFSKKFGELVKLNEQTCVSRPGSDVCKWNWSKDIYLNTQESDPKLNFENSEFVAHEIEPGTVDVSVNVFPSAKAKANTSYYKRRIRFVLVREENKWVVDNIFKNAKSIRQLMQDEINFYYLKK